MEKGSFTTVQQPIVSFVESVQLRWCNLDATARIGQPTATLFAQ